MRELNTRSVLLCSKEYLFMSFCQQDRVILEALNTSERYNNNFLSMIPKVPRGPPEGTGLRDIFVEVVDVLQKMFLEKPSVLRIFVATNNGTCCT